MFSMSLYKRGNVWGMFLWLKNLCFSKLLGHKATMRLSLQMCAQPEQSPTPLWLKFGPSSSAGTILCSCKGDEDLGHHCLSTDNEGTAGDRWFGKFRWVLVPAGRSSEYWISNAAFGGALYVSDHSFHSEGQTMKSVYVWTDPDKEAPPLLRQLWQVQEKGDHEFHVVSKFNDQVLCVVLGVGS